LPFTARVQLGIISEVTLPSSPPYLFTERPGRSSNARVERAPSECARSASRKP